MGVPLSDTTAEPVRPEVRRAVEADARRPNKGPDWWAENLIFFRHPDRPEHLTGDTKVYLGLGDDAFLDEEDGEAGPGEAAFADDPFVGTTRPGSSSRRWPGGPGSTGVPGGEDGRRGGVPAGGRA